MVTQTMNNTLSQIIPHYSKAIADAVTASATVAHVAAEAMLRLREE